MSRCFGPRVGIDEDPVTGSAHCALGPYWAERLGRTELVGYQASARGGVVRVSSPATASLLGGTAVTVLRGELIASSTAAAVRGGRGSLLSRTSRGVTQEDADALAAVDAPDRLAEERGDRDHLHLVGERDGLGLDGVGDEQPLDRAVGEPLDAVSVSRPWLTIA